MLNILKDYAKTDYAKNLILNTTLDMNYDETPETTAHLRIANLSIPDECNTTGFSQSACGFVIEFTDIITTHRINPFDLSNTTTAGLNNKGGSEYSDMRSYLNSTTYVYESINYSNGGIYNALPSELKTKIISTSVVSSHGYGDSANFTTTDRLYLLSTKEVWGKDGINHAITTDSAEIETRQLDYYKVKGVTRDANYVEVIKKNLNGSDSPWWLRSVASNSNYDVYQVNVHGDVSRADSLSEYGVSPAFRIAKQN